MDVSLTGGSFIAIGFSNDLRALSTLKSWCLLLIWQNYFSFWKWYRNFSSNVHSKSTLLYDESRIRALAIWDSIFLVNYHQLSHLHGDYHWDYKDRFSLEVLTDGFLSDFGESTWRRTSVGWIQKAKQFYSSFLLVKKCNQAKIYYTLNCVNSFQLIYIHFSASNTS